MKNTTLKQKLKNNVLTIGSWITIGHPSIAEIMGNVGFDWLTIDMEHNSIDPSMMQTLIATIQSKDIAALVRVARNDEVNIKHAMDAGADGVIVPMINSAEDAARAVAYVKYPPEGRRGVGLSRAQNYGNGFNEYRKWLKNHAVVIAQIEHIDGIANLEEILTTEGIDCTIIGPYDLSGSLGCTGDLNNTKMVEAVAGYKSVCASKNMSYGIHVINSEYIQLQEKINDGFTFIAFSTDFYFLGDRIKQQFQNKIIKQK